MLKFEPLGACTVCSKSRSVLMVTKTVGICDACSYVIREEWNDIKMLRVPALDPKIATTYVVIPRRHPSRSELDVSAYEFVTTAGSWPMTAYNPDKKELAKWLLSSFGIVTWPMAMTRIYAGFDQSSRFAEVVLLTLWGYKYDPPTKDESLGWSGFQALLSPETTKGAFVIGAKAGFEGFLQRRELAPAVTTECTVLSEMAVRYLAIKFGEEHHPIYGSNAMADVCLQKMASPEKVLVGQLLGMTDVSEKPVPMPEKQVLPPPDLQSSEFLDDDVSAPDAVVDDSNDMADNEDDEDEAGSMVRGPFESEALKDDDDNT